MSLEVPTDALEAVDCELGGRRHRPACFLSRDLHLWSACCQIVCTSTYCTERRHFVRVHGLVVEHLLAGRLGSRSAKSLASFYSQVSNELLCLGLVCFLPQTIFSPTDDAIQNSSLFVVTLAQAKPASLGDLESLFQFRLEPI